MLIVQEDLATVDQAKAYHIGDVLLVRLAGTKPTGCHLVLIERSLLDVEPPAFVARLATDPRVRCGPDPVPFEEQRAFRVGILREQVILHHSGGQLDVDVEDLTPPESLAPGQEPTSPIFDTSGEPREAVGYSKAYDVGEALRDAMSKLSSPNSGMPDWLSTYTIVTIGAEVGGIAGFNHLKVHVTGG